MAHCIVIRAGELVVIDQVPGPTRGTSATSKDGRSRPDSAPLAALSACALATGPTLEAISFEEKLACGAFVDGTVESGRIASVVLVVGEFAGNERAGGLVVVDESRVVTPGVVVVIDRIALTRGVELDAVRVKTRTRSKRGLDHVTQ
ncbi:MAG TPA: hypothetical protein VNF08_01770 [Acidimicrobiales bacterium]|nr:hypothetical protein [Acidimicrobiales bacterium]